MSGTNVVPEDVLKFTKPTKGKGQPTLSSALQSRTGTTRNKK